MSLQRYLSLPSVTGDRTLGQVSLQCRTHANPVSASDRSLDLCDSIPMETSLVFTRCEVPAETLCVSGHTVRPKPK